MVLVQMGSTPVFLGQLSKNRDENPRMPILLLWDFKLKSMGMCGGLPLDSMQ